LAAVVRSVSTTPLLPFEREAVERLELEAELRDVVPRFERDAALLLRWVAFAREPAPFPEFVLALVVRGFALADEFVLVAIPLPRDRNLVGNPRTPCIRT
jgi:hypothetical protein